MIKKSVRDVFFLGQKSEPTTKADIKTFVGLVYRYWIIDNGKLHYTFTIEVNNRLSGF